VAVSNKLTSETNFKIKEKEAVKVELINKTLTITNIGNIPYNKTILVKIGNKSINIETKLCVDKTQKYTLTAPEGKYNVEILADGQNKISQSVMLTGKAINVKENSRGIINFIIHPLVWIFIIAVLGFVAFIVYKKGYKRSFIGYIRSEKKEKKEIPLRKNSIVNTKNKTELSLSIKGDKQNASLVCLKIKNLKEIQSKKGNSEEALQKIVNLAEEDNAQIYESQDNLFFILAPVITKTFKNEKTALDLAQKIKKQLEEHNKKFRQKIEFGISLNYGTIIAKQEKEILKFMSMGTFITTAKKISCLSKGEILLSEKIRDRLIRDLKAEKHTEGKTIYFSIKEIKHKKENKKFISEFLKRLEGKK